MIRSVISHLCGGLGNQMFQYAAGRALSLRTKTPLELNISWFANIGEGNTVRTFQLLSFPNIADTVSTIEVKPPSKWENSLLNWIRLFRDRLNLPHFFWPRIVPEPGFAYWPGIKNISSPAALHGYWQCERYFADFSDQLRKDLAYPPLAQGYAQDMGQKILSCSNAVSVHIRRGDYVSNAHVQAFHGLTGQDYYKNALEYLGNHCDTMELFLFSDDPQWTRTNFDSHGYKTTVVDVRLPDAPHHDMHLMSLCRHHIIANSSFSWWGAWLGDNLGLTIAPKHWFADKNIDTSDIIPRRWLQF